MKRFARRISRRRPDRPAAPAASPARPAAGRLEAPVAPALSLARAETLGHRLGGYTLRTPTLQRNSFEDFDDYDEAKKYSTVYAKALLDEQKDDPIEDHFQKDFDSDQQREIYKVNKEHYGEDKIIADDDGTTILVKQDTRTTPHVDHRFPKSKGGSNSFTNAAVISARQNIKKGNKLDLDAEPDQALPPYRGIAKLDFLYKPTIGKEFSSEQRRMILDANKDYYGKGVVKSDADGKTSLSGRYDSSRVPHIDHITAKVEGGTNYYFNAQVLPANRNIRKSGKKGTRVDLDYGVGQMSLTEYYEKKKEGEVTPFAIEKY